MIFWLILGVIVAVLLIIVIIIFVDLVREIWHKTENKEDKAFSFKKYFHRLFYVFFHVGKRHMDASQIASGKLNWKQLFLGVLFDIGSKTTDEIDPAKNLRKNLEKEIGETLAMLEKAKENADRLKSKEAMTYVNECMHNIQSIYGQLDHIDSISEIKEQLRIIKEQAKIIAEAATFDDAAVTDPKQNTGTGQPSAVSVKNYYDILGVSKNATADEIKAAFRKLAMQYHPDRYSGLADDLKKQAEDKFKEINEAYQTLSDPQKRADYDKLLN